MTTPSRVMIVAHDAGGARAVIPVSEALQRAGAIVSACVAGPAAALWPLECRDVIAAAVDDALPVAEARRRLRVAGSDTVCTASGLYNRLEHTFRVAARAEGLRSIAVLDSWLNDAERFERTTDGLREVSRPHIVCAIDDRTRRGMLDAGFTAEQVVVTGPPNIERSVQIVRAVTTAERAAWRAEAEIDSADLVVAFFSEPFVTGPHGARFEGPGAIVGKDGRSLYGYTAVGVLEILLQELGAASHDFGRRCAILVKPHPSEWSPPLETVVAAHRSPTVRAVLCDASSGVTRVIAMADVAIGMMSIALLEAAVAGSPTLSVQPGLLESGADDPCLASILGYAHPIYERAALRHAVRRLVEQGPAALARTPDEPLLVNGAAERVADVILERTTAECTGAGRAQ
jgi:hypothetical protein